MKESYCNDCGRIHYVVAEKVKDDFLLSMEFLQNRLEISSDIFEKTKSLIVVKACSEVKENTSVMLNFLWKEIADEYKLNLSENNYNVDFKNKTIYYTKDENHANDTRPSRKFAFASL